MGRSPERKRPPWGPLGLIAGGLLLFLFAAAGGFTVGGLSLVVADNLWQILLSAVGVVLIAVGGLLLAEEGKKRPSGTLEKNRVQSAEWRVTMIRPARFQRRMVIEGGCLNRPPPGSLRLFTVQEDGRFRPQSIAVFDAGERRWSGTVDLGPGSYYSVYVVVAVVDAAGIALWDYFYQVGEKTDWELVGGSFAAFAAICDRFLVEGTIYE